MVQMNLDFRPYRAATITPETKAYCGKKEDYQKLILEHLQNDNGYIIRSAKNDFNSGLAMDTELLFTFFRDTQKEAFEKLEKTYKNKTQETVFNLINNEINKKNRA